MSTMVLVKYNCSHCGEKLDREVRWIDPKSFKKKPQMKSVFWCTSYVCGEAIALLLEFKPDNKVEIVKEQSTLNLYNPSKDEVAISARPRSKSH